MTRAMTIQALPLALLFSATSGLRAQNRSTNYPPQSVSQTVCPWFTQGSAANALGGEVSVTVKVSNTGEGSCKFARQKDSTSYMEILVSKASVPACPSDSVRLTGVGNEATRCKLRESHGDSAEIVNSRVREMHFSVTLSMHGQKASTKPSDISDDILQQIAEQVAGNLY